MWIPTINWKIAWELYYITSHLCPCRPKAFKDTVPVKLFQEWMIQKRHGGYEIEIWQIYPLQRRAISKRKDDCVCLICDGTVTERSRGQKGFKYSSESRPSVPFHFWNFSLYLWIVSVRINCLTLGSAFICSSEACLITHRPNSYLSGARFNYCPFDTL